MWIENINKPRQPVLATGISAFELHYDKSQLLYQIWPASRFFSRWMTLGLLLCIQLYSNAGGQALDFFDWDFEFWSSVGIHASCQLSNPSQYLYAALDLLCIECAQCKNTGRRQQCWHLTMSFLVTRRWCFLNLEHCITSQLCLAGWLVFKNGNFSVDFLLFVKIILFKKNLPLADKIKLVFSHCAFELKYFSQLAIMQFNILCAKASYVLWRK